MKSLQRVSKTIILTAFLLLQLANITDGQSDCIVMPGSHALKIPPPEFPDFIRNFGASIEKFAVLFGESFQPAESCACAHKIDWTISNAGLCSSGNQTNYIENACNPTSTKQPPIQISSTTKPSTSTIPTISPPVTHSGISLPVTVIPTGSVTTTDRDGNGTGGPLTPGSVVGKKSDSTAIIAAVVCSVGGIIIIAAVIALVCRRRGGAECCNWFHSIKDLRRQKSEMRPITETPGTSVPATPSEIPAGTLWSADGGGTIGRTVNGKTGRDNFTLLREDSSTSAVFPDIYAEDSSPTRSGVVTSPARSLRIALSVIGESSSDMTLKKSSLPVAVPENSEEEARGKPEIDLMRFNSISVDGTGKKGKENGRETELYEILDVETELAYKKQKELEEDVDTLDGLPGDTPSAGSNVVGEAAAREVRPADQTLKRNLVHYVEAKDKPAVAKKTSFAQAAAKQKSLLSQNSVTSPDENDTLRRNLSRKPSDDELVDYEEIGFDNNGFIPDTPVSDGTPSMQTNEANNGYNEATLDDGVEINGEEDTLPNRIPLNIEWDEWVNKAFDQVLDPNAASLEPVPGVLIESGTSPVDDSHQRRRSHLRHADSDVNNESVPFETLSPTSPNFNNGNEVDMAIPDVSYEPVKVSDAAAKWETANKSATQTGKKYTPKVVITKPTPATKFVPPTSPKVQNTLTKKPPPPAIPTKLSKSSSASTNLFPTSPISPTSNRTRLSGSVSSPTSTSPPSRSPVVSTSSEVDEVMAPVASIREQFEQKSNKQTKINGGPVRNGRVGPNNLNKK